MVHEKQARARNTGPLTPGLLTLTITAIPITSPSCHTEIVNANITARQDIAPAAPTDTDDLARMRQEVIRPLNRNIRARFRPLAHCVPTGGSARNWTLL